MACISLLGGFTTLKHTTAGNGSAVNDSGSNGTKQGLSAFGQGGASNDATLQPLPFIEEGMALEESVSGSQAAEPTVHETTILKEEVTTPVPAEEPQLQAAVDVSAATDSAANASPVLSDVATATDETAAATVDVSDPEARKAEAMVAAPIIFASSVQSNDEKVSVTAPQVPTIPLAEPQVSPTSAEKDVRNASNLVQTWWGAAWDPRFELPWPLGQCSMYIVAVVCVDMLFFVVGGWGLVRHITGRGRAEDVASTARERETPSHGQVSEPVTDTTATEEEARVEFTIEEDCLHSVRKSPDELFTSLAGHDHATPAQLVTTPTPARSSFSSAPIEG